jgi:hypothetical protein
LSNPAVTHLLRPRVDHTIVYQRYYLIGFELATTLRIEGLPWPVSYVPGVPRRLRVLERWNRITRTPTETDSGHVGRYVAHLPDGDVRFAIDARDSHPVRDEEVLDWSDVYFKSSKWPGFEYGAEVEPIVNGNGMLDAKAIERLRALRNVEKDIDVVFISRVWGGREHNLRLFEELARFEGTTDLLAILPPGAGLEAEAAAIERLARIDVPAQTYMIGAPHLWARLARARVVVFRSGPHLCIPWRMLDLLAMGSCILWDVDPMPQWPVPLERDVHWASAGIERPLWGDPEESEYAKLAPAIEALLRDPERRRSLEEAAASYFDAHAAPARVADYVLDTLRRRT